MKWLEQMFKDMGIDISPSRYPNDDIEQVQEIIDLLTKMSITEEDDHDRFLDGVM